MEDFFPLCQMYDCQILNLTSFNADVSCLCLPFLWRAVHIPDMYKHYLPERIYQRLQYIYLFIYIH
jgi:hypothetical protein